MRFGQAKAYIRDVFVCVSIYIVFIKLRITAQSGPVILVILCHSQWSSQGGISDTCYENLCYGSDATKGTCSLYSSYLSIVNPERLALPCVCVCIYSFANNRAIHPCHPSYSMPLALVLHDTNDENL